MKKFDSNYWSIFADAAIVGAFAGFSLGFSIAVGVVADVTELTANSVIIQGK